MFPSRKMALHFVTLCLILAGLPARATPDCEIEAKTPSQAMVGLLVAGLEHQVVRIEQLQELAEVETSKWQNPFLENARRLNGLALFRGFDRLLPLIHSRSTETRELLKVELDARLKNEAQVEASKEKTKYILAAPKLLKTLNIPSSRAHSVHTLTGFATSSVIEGRPVVAGTFSNSAEIGYDLVYFDPFHPVENERIKTVHSGSDLRSAHSSLFFERNGHPYLITLGLPIAYDIKNGVETSYRKLKLRNIPFQQWKDTLYASGPFQDKVTDVADVRKKREDKIAIQNFYLDGVRPYTNLVLDCARRKIHRVGSRTLMTCIHAASSSIWIYDIDNENLLPPFKVENLSDLPERNYCALFEKNGEVQLAANYLEAGTASKLFLIDRHSGKRLKKIADLYSDELSTVEIDGEQRFLSVSEEVVFLGDFDGKTISSARIGPGNRTKGFFQWNFETYFYRISREGEFQVFDLRWHLITKVKLDEAISDAFVFNYQGLVYAILMRSFSAPMLYQMTTAERKD